MGTNVLQGGRDQDRTMHTAHSFAAPFTNAAPHAYPVQKSFESPAPNSMITFQDRTLPVRT